jgi:hypothetical protein
MKNKNYLTYAIIVTCWNIFGLIIQMLSFGATTILSWIHGSVATTCSFAFFLLYYIPNTQIKSNCKNCSYCERYDKDKYLKCDLHGIIREPKYCRNYLKLNSQSKLEKIKKRLINIKNEPYKGAPSSLVQLNRFKGKQKGLELAIEIIEEVKNQQ